MKQQCAELWKEVLSVKDAVDKAISKAGMMIRNSSTIASWKWVAKMEEFEAVQAAHARIQNALQTDAFWQRLSLNDALKVRKEVGPAEIQRVASVLVPQLKEDARRVFDNISLLQKQQTARIGNA